ncbi:MAG: DNA-directed RNA polymerase subunit alpha, partial [Dehalococcoidia bacterium]|nr:DNA-directed RNA polymerase subunit alpha [Dehalococcoidia bacterium]
MSKDFVLPIVECTESSQDYGRIVAAPLEKGFGVTLGNTLRRILLSSLPGAAVTWIKIDGVEHEFSTIPDVKEDTLQFIQNIKGLRFRFLSDRPGKLMLNVSGLGIVTGADIKTTADYELVNPGLYLATMDSKNSKLSVEMNVETGRGYLPADHSDEGLSVGSIPIDAIFSPVRKVDYKVEPTRVGQESTYEKLVLEVWTDLSVSAVEALSQAAQIMIDQLSNFAELVKVSIKAAEKQMLQSYLPPDQFNKPVGEIGFSTRTLNCLR